MCALHFNTSLYYHAWKSLVLVLSVWCYSHVWCVRTGVIQWHDLQWVCAYTISLYTPLYCKVLCIHMCLSMIAIGTTFALFLPCKYTSRGLWIHMCKFKKIQDSFALILYRRYWLIYHTKTLSNCPNKIHGYRICTCKLRCHLKLRCRVKQSVQWFWCMHYCSITPNA